MKSQDVLLLCLLIANKESRNYKQDELAKLLCMSSSTIHKSLKRLQQINLIGTHTYTYQPYKSQCIEFLTKGMGAFLPKEKFHPNIELFINNELHSYDTIRPITHMWSLINLAWIFPKPLEKSISLAIETALDTYLDDQAGLLSRKEAAKYLGVSPGTLAVWYSTKRYNIPIVKIGKLSKYNRRDLDLFIKGKTSICEK